MVNKMKRGATLSESLRRIFCCNISGDEYLCLFSLNP
ncbi:MAG: hypothetical protein RI894_2476 [Bacteroidota bacterium]|jgi:hypothetical protein